MDYINVDHGYRIRHDKTGITITVTAEVIEAVLREPVLATEYVRLLEHIIYTERCRNSRTLITVDASTVPRELIKTERLEQFITKSGARVRLRVEGRNEGTELYCPTRTSAEDAMLEEIIGEN
jgi:hypothetical protein